MSKQLQPEYIPESGGLDEVFTDSGILKGAILLPDLIALKAILYFVIT
jgi:hypothetical protein